MPRKSHSKLRKSIRTSNKKIDQAERLLHNKVTQVIRAKQINQKYGVKGDNRPTREELALREAEKKVNEAESFLRSKITRIIRNKQISQNYGQKYKI